MEKKAKEEKKEGKAYASLARRTLKDLNLLDLRQNLKKRDRPYVLPISNENRRTLESELFARSYKGVTDLVTKWLWPVPAFWAVRFAYASGYSRITSHCSVSYLRCWPGLPSGMATMVQAS